jgi:hypothetical protein
MARQGVAIGAISRLLFEQNILNLRNYSANAATVAPPLLRGGFAEQRGVAKLTAHQI